MIDQELCDHLEYRIGELLEKSEDAELLGFWCDGVMLLESDHHYVKENVRETGELSLRAFAGKSGQDKYELVLRLGEKALSAYDNGQSLKGYIPDKDEKQCISVDVVKRRITLSLD